MDRAFKIERRAVREHDATAAFETGAVGLVECDRAVVNSHRQSHEHPAERATRYVPRYGAGCDRRGRGAIEEVDAADFARVIVRNRRGGKADVARCADCAADGKRIGIGINAVIGNGAILHAELLQRTNRAESRLALWAVRDRIIVRDVDALYLELKSRLDVLPAANVSPPIDREYGQRDLTVVGPDGDIIALGSPIVRSVSTERLRQPVPELPVVDVRTRATALPRCAWIQDRLARTSQIRRRRIARRDRDLLPPPLSAVRARGSVGYCDNLDARYGELKRSGAHIAEPPARKPRACANLPSLTSMAIIFTSTMVRIARTRRLRPCTHGQTLVLTSIRYRRDALLIR
jgi:hypothetical protein